jgi:hypothetical protein
MWFAFEGGGSVSKAVNAAITTTIPGIATKNVGAVGQTFSCKMLATVWRTEEAGAVVNSNTFDCINRSDNTYTYTKIAATGTVLLESEPTWASLGTTAAAALEGVLPVDVYIPSATDTAAGLLSYYKEGTWTPAFADQSNLLDTSGGALSDADFTWVNASYTRIGNTVFVRLATVMNVRISTAGLDTYLQITPTGLPGFSDSTSLFGSASCFINASPYEKLPIGVGNITGNGKVWLTIGSASGLGVNNNDNVVIRDLNFTYKI